MLLNTILDVNVAIAVSPVQGGCQEQKAVWCNWL